MKSTSSEVSIALVKIKSGFKGCFNTKEVYEYNDPNYVHSDILIEKLKLEFSPYQSNINGNTFILSGLVNTKGS